ncbi:MAG: Uma2 family endonuclease [Candidatus Hydrogenedentes bacterium]|nr:Uma2 family endonuclease [Candidatus Hydrogenedentota bacterium]MBI3118557.1 Uma2 family endonuclease [Candidatus Hydrogenedentota bacterium]
MPIELQCTDPMTAEDLADPDVPEKLVELVEGELVTMAPAGTFHNTVAMNILFLFRQFCREHPEFSYGGDNDGFIIQRNPDTVLSPDASLFRRRSLSGAPWLEFAPEIAVEVLSPSNSRTEMAFKRHRYFDAGTEQFWLVDPEKRQIEFHERDGRVLVATGEEVIEGTGIASGMHISLTELFRDR